MDVGPGAESYETISDLVAATDAVVFGRIIDVTTGRTLGTTRYRAIDLSVDEVLAGAVDDTTILIEEEGWQVEPEGIIAVDPFHRSQAATVGETWLVAIHYKEFASAETKRPTYGVFGRMGFFSVTPSGVETRSNLTDSTGRNVATLSLDELKAEFKLAAKQATAAS